MEPESLVQHASRTVLKIDALRPVDDHSRCKGQDRLQSDGQPEGRLSAPEDANKAANKGVQFFLLPFFFFFAPFFFFLSLRGLRGETANLAAAAVPCSGLYLGVFVVTLVRFIFVVFLFFLKLSAVHASNNLYYHHLNSNSFVLISYLFVLLFGGFSPNAKCVLFH